MNTNARTHSQAGRGFSPSGLRDHNSQQPRGLRDSDSSAQSDLGSWRPGRKAEESLSGEDEGPVSVLDRRRGEGTLRMKRRRRRGAESKGERRGRARARRRASESCPQHKSKE